MDALRFAATKIQPPRTRAARIARAALEGALARALREHRVVLLQAPAGFGKTIALAALWSALPSGEAAAWVSLDEDDDAERLFACLVAALEPHDLPWRTSPEALIALAGGERTQRLRAAAELVNALADSDTPHGAIVLDDVHRLADEGALALLETLIERAPAHWTLVLASRTAPPLALARLRASGDLAEFSQEELRFTRAEAEALLAAEALPQTDGRAAELFERTGGWPAGLRLALAALRARPGSRVGLGGGGALIDRHLFDYLAAEVLDDMPDALSRFLMRTSVLPELTALRAAAVSGDERAVEWLDEIERRGLFVTALDASERTLVLHDLFREALQARLREKLPGELPRLLQRAAAGETDPMRQVGYLLRAADWPAAEAALAEAAPGLFLGGGAGEVLRLVEQFPPGQRSARLLRQAAVAACLRWQWVAMARWCEAAVETARAAGERDELHAAQAYLANALYPLDRNAEAETLIAALAAAPDVAPATRAQALMADCSQHFRRGEHTELPRLYGRVLDELEAGAPLFRWWECAPPINWTTIAGMPPLIERYLAGAAPRLGEQPLPMRGELRLLRALLRLWAGRVDDALTEVQAAEDDMKWLAVSGEMQVGVDLFRMISDAMRGRAEALQQRLRAAVAREDDAPEPRRRLWRHQMAIYGVRLTDTLGGDTAQLRAWAAMLRETPLDDATSQIPRAVAVRARFAAAEGRWADAIRHFELLAPKLPNIDVMGQRTDLTLRFAHAYLRAGRVADAAATAAPVLERLQREGVRGQALLCGPVLLQTLAQARWGHALAPELHAELRAAAALSASLGGAAVAAPPAADEPVSAREREVLERIAAGDSNKLIARALDISPHTVKRHVANILDKLGLSSRAQAGAWLREHGGGSGS
jgi:LuxR family transcriptional regulator, maltose regulon positive regulatory protein